jgi:hypothetical protein
VTSPATRGNSSASHVAPLAENGIPRSDPSKFACPISTMPASRDATLTEPGPGRSAAGSDNPVTAALHDRFSKMEVFSHSGCGPPDGDLRLSIAGAGSGWPLRSRPKGALSEGRPSLFLPLSRPMLTLGERGSRPKVLITPQLEAKKSCGTFFGRDDFYGNAAGASRPPPEDARARRRNFPPPQRPMFH